MKTLKSAFEIYWPLAVKTNYLKILDVLKLFEFHIWKRYITYSILYTLFQYADPVADLLDKWDVFACRLFRESCVFHRGNYVKDLSRLGRELHKIIIVDNSPASYVFHPDNTVKFNFIHLQFNEI